MIQENFSIEKRGNKRLQLQADFVVIGGGLAGVCAAVSAARQGAKTILIQDRPVLGGNASSEVRLWALGATSHMGNNNRWSREGGLIDEIMVENVFRNKEGNPIIFDTILLEKVTNEPNVTLLLNTAVSEVEKKNEREIKSVYAFNSQTSTAYDINAPLFCDASGDGIVAFQAGASYRIGAEAKDEFGEGFAPDDAYGELLGHSMFFYSKPVDKPVKYVPPAYALDDISRIPRHKLIRKDHKGCNFWWFEYGGRSDTIHDTENIKWELWKVIYGVWDYIKNSGTFDGVENLTLEWVANVPGKRESRRFNGHYMLKQQDVVEQRRFEDAIAFGGWALDLHPADGVYSELSGCTQWHSKGVYDLPYRSYLSRDIDNLFLAGRIISASHVAFGSSRVMLTCAFGGQAVGTAAALCRSKDVLPAQLLENGRIKDLQNALNLNGQSIPDVPIDPESNLLTTAKRSASSTLELSDLPADGDWLPLTVSAAQILPLQPGQAYRFTFSAKAEENTELTIQLRCSEKAANYTPELILETKTIQLQPGEQQFEVAFEQGLPKSTHGFVTFLANPKVALRESRHLRTGVLSVFNGENKKVSNKGVQTPPEGIGVDVIEFWIPARRPAGRNVAFSVQPAITAFDAENIGNGFVRPWCSTNAWVADPEDDKPTLLVEWPEAKTIERIRLFFDTDYDHAMETVQYDHPEDVVPFCLRNYKVFTWEGELLKTVTGNHQTINTLQLEAPLSTKGLRIEAEHPSAQVPAAIFEVVVQ